MSVDHTVLKLGDFGLARATEGTRQTKTQIGSYRYMAPEVVKSGGHYSKKADVHSYGESMAIVAISAMEKSAFFSVFCLYLRHEIEGTACVCLHLHCIGFFVPRETVNFVSRGKRNRCSPGDQSLTKANFEKRAEIPATTGHFQLYTLITCYSGQHFASNSELFPV